MAFSQIFIVVLMAIASALSLNLSLGKVTAQPYKIRPWHGMTWASDKHQTQQFEFSPVAQGSWPSPAPDPQTPNSCVGLRIMDLGCRVFGFYGFRVFRALGL